MALPDLLKKWRTKKGVNIKIDAKGINTITITLVVVLSFVIIFQWDANQSLKDQLNTAKNGVVQTYNSNNAVAAATPTPTAGPLAPVTSSDHILGDPNAQIVIVEYSDLECPYCKTFQATMQQVMSTYGNKVAWVYRQWPLSFHANADKEAQASECVAKLGGNSKFWTYIGDIYSTTTSNGTGFALDKLAPLAASIGIDENSFNTCLNSGEMKTIVQKDLASGTSAGVQGTPGSFAVSKNGTTQFINGALPFAQIQSTINSLL
jgi:protein-disulfide isomerase